MYCGDVGQNTVEEIDVISKGSNYGWSRFEGNNVYNGQIGLQGKTTHAKPIMTYTHRQVGGYASVTGGYVIRNNRDTRLTGKYIFADISGAIFLAEESPPDSGQWVYGRIQSACSSLSPHPCQGLGSLYSFGEMHDGDIVMAGVSGSVFRIIEPSKCGPNPPTRSPVVAPSKSPTLVTRSPTRQPCSKITNKTKCKQRTDCELVRQKRCRQKRSG